MHYYAPLQAVIKSFEINYTFSSILILVASIYCKKTPSRWEKRLYIFIFHTKCKIFRSKVQRSNIYQISKCFIFVLFEPNTNFLDPTVLEIGPFQNPRSTLIYMSNTMKLAGKIRHVLGPVWTVTPTLILQNCIH
jgi:hypothetical protein